MNDIWDLQKTDIVIIFSIFAFAISSINSKDLLDLPCAIICYLLCSIILYVVIRLLFPPEEISSIAAFFIIVAGLAVISKVVLRNDNTCVCIKMVTLPDNHLDDHLTEYLAEQS